MPTLRNATAGAFNTQTNAASGGGGGGSGPYTLQFHGSSVGSPSSDSDSTGATLIVVALHYFSAPGATPLADNKGNSYTALTMYDNPGPGTYRVQFYWCANPTVGTGHHWTSTANFVVMDVFGFAGVSSPAKDGSETGDHTTQPGSITPSTSADVFITAVTGGGAPSGGSFSCSGYTIPDGTHNSSSLYAAAGYKIKTDSTAENPTWSDVGVISGVTLVAFK